MLGPFSCTSRTLGVGIPPFWGYSLLHWKGLRFPNWKDMNGDKALGLDGFTTALWQSSWGIVRGEVIGMFRDFFCNWEICS